MDPNIKALKRRGFINHGSTVFGSNPVDAYVTLPKATFDGQAPNLQPFILLVGRLGLGFRVLGFRVLGFWGLGLNREA